MRGLLLLAASGLAREVIASNQHDYRFIGILDDDPVLHGETVAGIPVLGGLGLAAEYDTAMLVCIGSGARRRTVVESLSLRGVGADRFGTVIDASVRLPESCSVGAGSIILAGTVLTADVKVGAHVVVMPNCTLTHDDVIEDYVTIAAGVSLGGGVRLGAASYLGMNASVRQRVNIGEGALVGMAAAVLSDIPAGETWVGLPAAPLGARVRT